MMAGALLAPLNASQSVIEDCVLEPELLKSSTQARETFQRFSSAASETASPGYQVEDQDD
jgi:hypothetical protein